MRLYVSEERVYRTEIFFDRSEIEDILAKYSTFQRVRIKKGNAILIVLENPLFTFECHESNSGNTVINIDQQILSLMLLRAQKNKQISCLFTRPGYKSKLRITIEKTKEE